MLDCLSNGRIVSGFARGIPREYNVYTVPLSESRARFERQQTLSALRARLLGTATGRSPILLQCECRLLARSRLSRRARDVRFKG